MEEEVTKICRMAQRLGINELARVVKILSDFLDDMAESEVEQAQGDAEAEHIARGMAEQEAQEARDEEYYYSQQPQGPEF